MTGCIQYGRSSGVALGGKEPFTAFTRAARGKPYAGLVEQLAVDDQCQASATRDG